MPIFKLSYVAHVPGHHNSKGELAEWCVKQHNTGKILTSYTSEKAAKEGLRNMEIHKGSLHQAAVIDSPQFQAWFTGSEVVDKRGNPQVMYHATQADIDVFLPYSHFGTQEAANDRYSDTTGFYNDILKNPARSKGSNVVPVYLNVKNPLRMPDLASLNEDTGVPLDQFNETENMDEDERPWARDWEGEEAVATTLLEMGIFDIDEFEKARDNEDAYKILQQKGYDGIVYKNSVEDAGNDSWIVFNPNQVKSAIGNNGAYDLKNNQITSSLKSVVSLEEQWENILRDKGYIINEAKTADQRDRIYTNITIPDILVQVYSRKDGASYAVKLNGILLEQGENSSMLRKTLDNVERYSSPVAKYDYEANGNDIILISPWNTAKLLEGHIAKDFWVSLDHLEDTYAGNSEIDNQRQDLIRNFMDRV